jgi:hypothetical protein
MPNLYTVKETGALLLTGILPTIMFFFFLLFGYGVVYSLVAWGVAIAICVVIYKVMVRHPLVSVAKGSGLMGMTFDSTGVIEPFLVKVMPPFIEGEIKSQKKKAVSLFDREAIMYMKLGKNGPPQAEMTQMGEKEIPKDLWKDDPDFIHYDLKIPKGKETDITFSFMQYPCFIYNKNMGAFLTKSALSKIETEGVIKHLVLYLKVKTEELTSIMRDFARYVIEMTKPKTSFLAGKMGYIVWIVFGAAILLLVVMFGPSIASLIGPALGGAKGAVGSAASQLPQIPTGIQTAPPIVK